MEEEHTSLQGHIETLVEKAKTLVAAAPTRGAALDTWKWELGDVIAEVTSRLDFMFEQMLLSNMADSHSYRQANESRRICLTWYRDFVEHQRISRDTLVDYGHIARIFPSGDPMRTNGLTFCHVRAISRVKSGEARTLWGERALQSGWSVARLQAEINAAGGISTAPDGPIKSSKRSASGKGSPSPNSTYHCAHTKRPILDRSQAIEMRVHPRSPLASPEKRKPRGGGGKPGRNGEKPEAFEILRFESSAALLAWLTERDTCAASTAQTDNQAPTAQADHISPVSQMLLSPGLQKSLDRQVRQKGTW